MKRVVIAIIMLLFAISISSLNAYLINKKIISIENSVEIIYNKPDRKKIRQITDEWNNSKSFLKFVTVHEIVNDLDILFASLEIEENNESIKDLCNEIITTLNFLKNSEKLLPENIF